MREVKNIILVGVVCVLLSGCVRTSKVVRPVVTPPAPVPPAVEEKSVTPESPPVIAQTAKASKNVIPRQKTEIASVPSVEPVKVTMPEVKITYSDITNLLSEFINMRPIEREVGPPEYMGVSENNLVTLKVVGPEQNITRASMILLYPEDISAINTDLNKAMMLRFLRNAAPGFGDWSTRVNDIIAGYYNTPAGNVKIETIPLQDRTIKISYNKKQGSITITIEHK